ncbi:acetyl-CoA C-acyltransferase family protein [Polynucleobacter paneuropaeus]|jgi:acetyl-CoA C-acetyltransferase|uniref:Acetyl-CoA C-acyltransferase n=1 Tax=Polynucleobacter paneuropaeus TaxID=2527775 RepID=A0A9Q7CPY8_9BURK|nr:acetyl-CoA C-acyltransferase family protein [Polynucleobacter paneuropaeus]AWW46129.1 acetyl-CoA C-acyltransferase [Polynucleobacter paneuropaeus]MBT8514281.1 acetyl-CoA C-acyltransferase family protein [Polynucleobacter paneuropaeus]MBT8520962.1 acetyl-CoA C-acyltransferase family protein [Polynucleobacter paneuropaeus]MBT8524124.1 acetyl-CoA C-acyltransferase family protein [Polynucleobacter paneuropaeus]MBT8528205.1 acetyl-CoA C-acyltransferase family protein [Polynucleobacter paneuropae
MSRDVVVLSAVRSAIGSFGGSLSSFEPAELGGIVMKEAVARSGVDPALINYVTVGNTIPTDSRYAYVARVAAIQAGLPMESVAMALNRLCSSGLQAIVSTSQAIMLNDCDFGIGGGVEVMSRGMYGSPAMRSGARMGDSKMIDLMVAVLTDPFGVGHMGVTAENLVEKWKLTREEQDALACESHRRAAVAIKEGRFKSQIVPITIKSRKGDVVFDTDEHCKPDTTMETLGKMKAVFKKEGGSVTAGNASGINDGAAFFVLAAADAAAKAGHKPIARLVSYAVAGVPNHIMGEGPIPASKLALARAGLKLDQIDVIESNEAFAAQALAVTKGLGLDPAKTNVNGGAIALGHPIGCSGAAIATKALHELQRVNGKYALVTMCIGGGQGIATIFERI